MAQKLNHTTFVENRFDNSCTTFNVLMRNSKTLPIEHIRYLTVLRMELKPGNICLLKENISDVSEMNLIHG